MSPALSCPVCGGTAVSEFLHRDNVVPHQNALMATRRAAREVTRGTLSLVVCGACGFIHNQAFDQAIMAYGEDYDNAQTHSPAFRAYVDGLAERLIEDFGMRDCRIVEVGCGDGYFLRKLVEDPARGNLGVGFDPSYRGPDRDAGGRLRFERRFYDADCASVAADLVVCRHVIEHVPDPIAMLRSVRAALGESPTARVFFETPCVDWIFAGNVIWDLFYEHCSYFTAASLSCAFERAGFQVFAVDRVFGGQYLWLEARPAEGETAPEPHAGTTPDRARRMGAGEARLLDRLAAQIEPLRRNRRTAIWGAGAKGVTLANLLDAEARLFDCIIDINPNKQGCFIAGSGHQILSPRAAAARGVEAALLTNPNYRAEIEAMAPAMTLLEPDLTP